MWFSMYLQCSTFIVLEGSVRSGLACPLNSECHKKAQVGGKVCLPSMVNDDKLFVV